MSVLLGSTFAMTVAATVSTETTTSVPTARVSVDSDEAQANGRSGVFGGFVDVSGNGRFVAFVSEASNLVGTSDGNGNSDVFVRDLEAGITELASVTATGAAGNGGSNGPFISASGRFVVFNSGAGNLVAGDTNDRGDVFIRDRESGTTERVSVSSDEAEGNNMSSGGAASADGRYVTFTSYASNLVAGDTNGSADIFVRDRQLGTTERVSVSDTEAQATGGAYGPTSQGSKISADGNLVFFESDATNLVADDTNGYRDIFVRDRAAQSTSRVSLRSAGDQITTCCGASGVTISADGRFVAFNSQSNVDGTQPFQEAYLRDRHAGTTERVSLTDADGFGDIGGSVPSYTHGVSDDGRFVVFNSSARNMVAGDTNGTADVFVRDRQSASTRRVSVGSDGSQGNGSSANAAISATGEVVAFDSLATNLVTGDTNGVSDVFVNGVASTSGSGTGGTAPEGDRILFATDGTAYPHTDLWTVAPDGSDPLQVTSAAGTENHGTWSPDGVRIAYVQDSTAIRTANSDGSGTATTIHTGTSLNGTTWSPTASQLAFSSYNGLGTGYDVSVVGTDGTGLVNLTGPMKDDDGRPWQEGDPAWSPDGRKLAFLALTPRVDSETPGKQDVFLLDLDDHASGPRQLTTDGGGKSRVEWLPDGSAITFSASSGHLTAVDPDDGTTTSYGFSVGSLGYSWSPDGSKLAWAGSTKDLFVRTLSPVSQANITNTGLRVFYPEWRGTAPAAVSDSDGDGVVDGSDNCPDVANGDQADLDGDGAGDVCDTDDDGDGLSDVIEVWLGCDPRDGDSDGDGVGDLIEVVLMLTAPNGADTHDDPHGDGGYLLRIIQEKCGCTIGGADEDVNGNGVFDWLEYWYFGGLYDEDVDGGGSYGSLLEYIWHLCGCGPDDPASNGVPGTVERWFGTGGGIRWIIHACGCLPWEEPGAGGGLRVILRGGIGAGDLEDPDGDGLVTIVELLLGCDPHDDDSDGDGLGDREELLLGTSPTDADTDGDGMNDGREIELGCDPLDADTDDDGRVDGVDPAPLGTVDVCATVVAQPVVPVRTPVEAMASFGGPGFVSGSIAWGDGTSDSWTTAGAQSPTHTYTAAGVYTLRCSVTDTTTGTQTVDHEHVTVYDPNGGFVTGGGWIKSPAGAYAADPTVTGRANFGFVSKYKKGATVPTGELEFQVADLNFHSTAYEWLVVSGARAQYKGTGTINGAGDYGFVVTVTDEHAKGGGVDSIRVKIWDRATGAVVYDTQPGDAGGAAASTALSGGSIVIHRK